MGIYRCPSIDKAATFQSVKSLAKISIYLKNEIDKNKNQEMLCSSGYVLQDSKHIKIPAAGFGLLMQTFGLVR